MMVLGWLVDKRTEEEASEEEDDDVEDDPGERE